jgi:hypothetical protein
MVYTPNDSLLVVVCMHSNNWSDITKIKQEAEDSYIEKHVQFKSHNRTLVTSDYDLVNKPGFSPDGKYFIYSYVEGDTTTYIAVMETDSMEMVASLPYDYGGYVFGAIFTDDMQRAVVLNVPYDEYVGKPIVYLDGENSFIESEVVNYQAAFSGEYNPSNDMFYILLKNNYILRVDPYTGEIEKKIITSAENQWQMVLDDQQIPVIR